MSLTWLTGTVVDIIDETYNTKRYFIQVDASEHFDFTAGQFVTLDLPIHEKPNKRWRSYSIASAPNGTAIYELLIVLVEDGLGTPYMFKNWELGSKVIFRGPLGVFTLKEEQLQHDLFLVCTGTGIAPFRSMLHTLVRENIPHKDIYLIYGCRTQEDLLYYEEMKNLELEDFHYIPTLSRAEWEGKKGYVHAIYEEHAAGKADANFFLCGWKNMIDEARQRIVQMGFDKKAVHFELYG
ncbi:FAD-binding oxidoreductase [Niabella pedocola]|uniref:FAD-binding oxidoreductase n=1 Tax=Niabella pedocola TaxID=1752077 RepID=A0ABS8PUN2_9BACT|nr:FAD-binding oxidoreductase [Niabella pedocola]MCD2424775.1 FAD-binding oxidoreductase [Niabella pedocola]